MNSNNFSLSVYLKDKRSALEEHLEKIILRFDRNRELVKAMRHSLMAGGKRLRPVLSMAAAEAVGKDFRMTLPAACAIEMIHTYSLIHDDLPAMDDDDLRRGIPTCHKAFSEATAILAGDALLTHAFTILARPDKSIFEIYPDKESLIELVAVISESAGADGMVEGQMMDMLSSEAVSLSPALKMDYLKKLHHLKTGRMIVAGVQAGAISVGADMDASEHLTVYAEKIGLAFQVTDDILNVEGDPLIMGKAAGSDQLHDKLTFPSLLGLEASKEFATRLVEDAVASLSAQVFRGDTDPLKAIAEYIIKRNR